MQKFKDITDLFSHKVITDENGIEYVLYANSTFNEISGIDDRTAFEALENHVHLLDRIKASELDALSQIGANLGNALLACLKMSYPDKHFYVYVSIDLGDSFIIRFCQKWEGEPPYYPEEYDTPNTKLITLQG